MDVFESHGRLLEIAVASNLISDGMSLELTELPSGEGSGPVLEALWHDDGSGFDFRSY